MTDNVEVRKPFGYNLKAKSKPRIKVARASTEYDKGMYQIWIACLTTASIFFPIVLWLGIRNYFAPPRPDGTHTHGEYGRAILIHAVPALITTYIVAWIVLAVLRHH